VTRKIVSPFRSKHSTPVYNVVGVVKNFFIYLDANF